MPPGFRKIRHYGFLANANRAVLQMQQNQMGSVASVPVIKKDWKTIAKEKMNYDVEACPCCRKGKMVTILNFDAHAPPDAKSLRALLSLIKGKTA